MALSVLWERCEKTVSALYDQGYRDFICGGATGFDTLAASCISQMKEQRQGMRLILVLPCADQTRGWKETDQSLYNMQIEKADRVLMLSPHYYPGCMMVRNRFMVDHASFCVAYLDGHSGGTMSTVRYALHRHLPILNLAIEEEVLRYLQEHTADPLPF
ncbi:MAG: DUF1273 family protein [Clostridia bacterium]|nr:DUF1273 family protein [Clostridia bacterium]